MENQNNFWYYIFAIIFWIGLFILIAAISTKIWNILIPELFNGPTINFWQIIGLWSLSKFLFSGFDTTKDK